MRELLKSGNRTKVPQTGTQISRNVWNRIESRNKHNDLRRLHDVHCRQE